MKNRDTVQKALDILRETMAPWVCMQVKKIEGYDQDDETWWREGIVPCASSIYQDQQYLLNFVTWEDRTDELDIQACCNIVEMNWTNLFQYIMNKKARSWNKLVQAARNDVAHIGAKDLTDQETTSALDNISLLAGQMDEEAQAEIQAIYRKHVYGNEQGSMSASVDPNAGAGRKSLGVMQTTPVSSLKSWRAVIEPHPDVARGQYKNAEFAADLAQVARGEGAYEYRDPVEFFSRTYVTEGMKGLLVQALRRVGGKDGEPVIQLKTAFGGGKTHSMLALYHLLRGRAPKSKLPGVAAVLEAAEIDQPPICSVAVLVGTAMDPTKARRPVQLPGVTVNTIWGEMAAQLAIDAGNPKLYDIVKESDKKGVSPGSPTLKAMLDACGPCVILIDELVAYARKIYGVSGLPAGSFENLLTFIQEITEAARASENSIVVASIPESNVEIGGEAGEKALAAIEHTFGRMESIWKPVAADEGFEIVRRRLFLPCKDEAMRDQVCLSFSQMYGEHSEDFPLETKEVDYMERMRACYPIHPEVFDRLYNDWATIERFQRTRGVLRLMAAVIHNLWMNQDGGLMIMPGSFSLDVPNIRDELTRHVGDNWNAIVDHEVDGKNSIPYQKDQQIPRFGKVMACRRVARTIMLGSAPSGRAQSIRGLEASRVRLGTVQPGESIAVFNDALNTLQNALAYLYTNRSAERYWYDTRPTLRKTAEDRAGQRTAEEVEMEVERRLRKIRREAPFSRLHICPQSSADVSDDMDVGIVLLPMGCLYRANQKEDTAVGTALSILNTRGLAPRMFRNMLVFIAPAQNSMPGLKDAAKQFLAWKSIRDDSTDLNLDAGQIRETESMIQRCDQTIEDRILETYSWLLVPYIDLEVSKSEIQWETVSIRGGTDTILAKAAKKLCQNEQLITEWAPALLKMELDRLLWENGKQKNVGELWKQLCTYCYLPRLASFDVLAGAIRRGAEGDGWQFAYAEGIQNGDCQGLVAGGFVPSVIQSGYVVEKTAALEWLVKDREEKRGARQPDPPAYDPREIFPTDPERGRGGALREGPGAAPPTATPSAPKNRHFFLSTELNEVRVIRDVQNLMDEVVTHISALDGAKVRIRIQVEAEIPDGAPVPTVRTVTENCRTLHVDEYEFSD